MIARIHGKIAERRDDAVLLENHGIFYEIFLPAITMARAAYEGSSWGESAGDAGDAYVRIAFRDRAPLDDDTACFERMARLLWDPIFAAAVESPRAGDQP